MPRRSHSLAIAGKLAFLALLAAAAPAPFAHAQTGYDGAFWNRNPATPGDWFDAANWNPGPPGPLASATIDNGGTAVISAGHAEALGGWIGFNDAGALRITGGSAHFTWSWRSATSPMPRASFALRPATSSSTAASNSAPPEVADEWTKQAAPSSVAFVPRRPLEHSLSCLHSVPSQKTSAAAIITSRAELLRLSTLRSAIPASAASSKTAAVQRSPPIWSSAVKSTGIRRSRLIPRCCLTPACLAHPTSPHRNRATRSNPFRTLASSLITGPDPSSPPADCMNLTTASSTAASCSSIAPARIAKPAATPISTSPPFNDEGQFRFAAASSTPSTASTATHPVDLNNREVTLSVGAGILDFSSGIAGAKNAHIAAGPDSLTILPAGFNPNTGFGTFNRQGMVHVAGNDLVLPAGKRIAGAGVIEDLVNARGEITAAGFGINLKTGPKIAIRR